MDNDIACQYDDIIDGIDMWDKKGNQILCSCDFEQHTGTEWIQLMKSIKNAEVSLLINSHQVFPDEMYRYCCLNNVFIYVELEAFVQSDLKDDWRDMEVVLLIEISMLEKVSQEILKRIVEKDCHVCVINVSGNIKVINDFYLRLLADGFSGLFSLASLSNNQTHPRKYNGLINRRTLAEFRTETNMYIKDEIEQLKKNALHRHNRNRTQKEQQNLQVVLINMNVALSYEPRKNLGIEYLASVLQKGGYKAQCIYAEKITFLDKIRTLLHREKEIKVIGFSCMQDNIYAVQNAIHYLKQEYPDITFTIGGAQALALKEEFIKKSKVDYIMVGESEQSYLQLINYIFHNTGEIEEIANLRFIDNNGNYVETSRGELIENLDIIPFPQYVYQKDDSLTCAGIITGRGCPYSCAFCYEGAKEKSVRYRSLENVFEEISVLIKNYKNLRVIQFYDDTFTVDSKRVMEFCEYYQEIFDKYKIRWVCEMHCQTVYNKPKLLKAMVRAGLSAAQIGLENGDLDVLKKLNKKITPTQIFDTINNCREAGLKKLEGNILLGGAGETREQLESQFEFAEKILVMGRGMFELAVVMFWPFPNTPIANNSDKYGVKLLKQECENTINCMQNIVTESEEVGRQEFVEHYYKLVEWIEQIYAREALKMNSEEAERCWNTNEFNLNSKWGQALAKYNFIRQYMTAKSKMQEDILQGEIYPVRTFDLLSYRDNCLYLKEAGKVFDKRQSQILELCNGKNTVKDVAHILHWNIENVFVQLKELKEKMYVYGV